MARSIPAQAMFWHCPSPQRWWVVATGLLLFALVGCQTHWTVVSDREAVLYAKPDRAIGYEPKARLGPEEPFVFSRPSLRAEISLLLLAGNEVANIRRRSADPRSIRLRPTDWVPCTARDREIFTTNLTSRMSTDEVVAAWGLPDRRSEVLASGLSRQTWTYVTSADTTCLYFDNGSLSGWSTVATAAPIQASSPPQRPTRLSLEEARQP
ncbi:MAG: hypothetical protein AB7O52_07270 [Planctomycetota bacterium]